ncbi:MAG: hypothetical protein RIB47_01545 [Cyclobacteriaceae bacterium]
MKFLLVFLMTVLTFNCAIGQEKTKQELFESFTISIIKPDTAKIADSLKVYADILEKRHRDRYFSLLKNWEGNFKKMKKHGTKEMKRYGALQIQQMKSRKKEIYKFKYYHTVAEKTLFELGQLFNSNYWESNYTSRDQILEGRLIDPEDLVNSNFVIMRNQFKDDYLVTFEDIHTDSRNGILILKYVVTLFSKRENGFILKKEIEGNAAVYDFKPLRKIFPPGNQHEYSVDCENYLECVMLSAIRFSTEELFKAISERQKK